MSKEKLARRKAMGDDPTAIKKSGTSEAGMISHNYGRPMPGNPDQKNNVDLNPMVSQSMGGGAPTSGSFTGENMYPYNDGGIPSAGGQMGSVGFVGQSNIPQNQTIGQGYNSKFRLGEISSPREENARMMEPYYLAEEAATRAQRLYGEGSMPSYTVGPLGMMGTPVEVGRPNPGQFPANLPQQSEGYLPLTGMVDSQQSISGMNTSTGGRNKTKGDK